jgi:hypothetical protein
MRAACVPAHFVARHALLRVAERNRAGEAGGIYAVAGHHGIDVAQYWHGKDKGEHDR